MKMLDKCQVGESLFLTRIITKDELLLSKLLTMGLVYGTRIKFVARAMLGDPIIIEACGYRLCLRKKEAACIEVG